MKINLSNDHNISNNIFNKEDSEYDETERNDQFSDNFRHQKISK